jgi:hypothetical protein
VSDVWDPSFEQRSPAFAPLADAIAPFRGHRDWPTIDEWNAHVPSGLSSAFGAPIRFFPQGPKRPDRLPYDESIYTFGKVPSRPRNWHDFFNMLVWLTFPLTKRAINARQRALLRPGAKVRTPEQDALAMLDEGGALVLTNEPIDDIVNRGDAEALARSGARVLILGHAIYEHLVLGRGAVRAFVQVIHGANDARAADRELAAMLERAPLVHDKSRLALPIVDALFAAR